MKKETAILLAILLVIPSIAYAIPTFIVQETEKISLVPNATDPDADKLVTIYSSPLNEKGEWQTNYGDAGEHKATITVSDGLTTDSKDVLIIVKKKEEKPKIESSIPTQDAITINESQSINFQIQASDLNKDKLTYEWHLDGLKVQERQEYVYEAKYNDSGQHKIIAVISDGISTITKEWIVNVNEVNLEGILDEIKDITINENEIAKLELPNFERYGLAYSISEPLGNKNEWLASFNDSGSYDIKIHADGKGFSKDKIIRLIVNDIDRAPVFEQIGNRFVKEDEDVNITLNAIDPDGDEVTYSATKLPEGATLQGNIFTWKPSYDTVKKVDFVDWVLDKFSVLSKSFYIQFAAASKDKKIIQNIIITVKDVNRAPVIENMEPITINEGESLKIEPNAYDLDGDKVKHSYSGFLNTNTFKSNFGDAGTYYVKVTASDDMSETSKSVQINIKHVNRAPIFGKINDIKASEGDDIAILLNANDPDGDEISYSLDNPLEGSSIKGNAFIWKPSYDLANKNEVKKFDLVFVAKDGQTETRQIAKAEISNKNRAPKIIDATKSITAKVNEPVLMFVKAMDEDGDELAYEWDFGFLDKYKATSTHLRTFTTTGKKAIKVTVSDGIDEVEQIINVNVV